jgi:hypothetical protein
MMKMMKLMRMMMKSGVIDGLIPFEGEGWHIGAGREPGRGMVPRADEMGQDTGAACRNQFAVIYTLLMVYDILAGALKNSDTGIGADKIRPHAQYGAH